MLVLFQTIVDCDKPVVPSPRGSYALPLLIVLWVVCLAEPGTFPVDQAPLSVTDCGSPPTEQAQGKKSQWHWKSQPIRLHSPRFKVTWSALPLWSIIPPTPQQRSAGPNAWKLQAANGSDIPFYGLADKQVCIANRTFDFPFIIADVRQSILGADF